MKAGKLGVIADDLTGSLDTGVQFGKWGLTSLVLLAGDPSPDVDCVVINTDSRAGSAEAARAAVKRAARVLRGRFVYKKIDSTLRGHIGVEVLAAMQELHAEKALLAPAYPANGRITEGGCVWIDGLPLHETEFARDPRNAIGESHIPALLQRTVSERAATIGIEVVNRGPEALGDAVSRYCEGLVVVDAVEPRHLAVIARAVAAAGGRWLPVGSAGLAEELPAALGLMRSEPSPPRRREERAPVLVVAGSRNQVTVAQVRRVSAVLALPTFEPDLHRLLSEDGQEDEMDRIAEAAVRQLVGGRGVVLTTCFTLEQQGASVDIALAMGRITGRVMREHPVGGLFLTGGDIALQVCRELTAHALRPITDVLPGVPVSVLLGGPWEGLRVVTKAGGFGQEDAIVQGVRYLMDGGTDGKRA